MKEAAIRRVPLTVITVHEIGVGYRVVRQCAGLQAGGEGGRT
jgi:hypothetical protein